MKGWLFLGVTAAVVSCGGSKPMLGTHERCVREGAPDRVRTGTLHNYDSSVDWDGRPRNAQRLFTITERRGSCFLTIAVTGPSGLQFENGPFKSVSGFRARTEPPTLVYFARRGDEGVVVRNGEESSTYDNLVFEPRFSNDGQHLAWVAKKGGTAIVYVDGVEQMRHPGIERVFKRKGDLHMSSFDILDDGRAVAFAAERDDKVRVFVGGKPHAQAFDDIPEQRLDIASDGTRFSYRARHGFKWVRVVDGEIVEHPGNPGKVVWNESGSYAFVVTNARVIDEPDRPRQPAEGYVLNGVYHPLEGASQIKFQNEHWILWTREPRTVVVLGVPTPEAEPTDDQYKPAGSRAMYAVRVRIGDSLGPVLDSVDTRSIRVEQGSVIYAGERNKRKVRVVDNVIQP